ncbi:MAG: BACON domain-containing protein [Bacteroidales bacterium]|nr:BACON domain-containing protein [Bacteroidales bacterium]
MKIRNLIMSLLAVAALAATGCREEEQDLGLPEVKVGTTQLSFDAGIGTNTVTVNTTRDWKAVATVDWIDVSPKSGVGYENAVLTISVLENEGYNRTGSVRVDIGYDYKTILVHQDGPLGEKTEGTGTLEDPFTPAGAAAAASALAADEEAGPYYIKGIITTISTTFEASGTYGNASFFISEDGTENTKSFQVYQTYYLGNKKWTSSLGPDVKVGDEVIIYGKLMNYRGNTPETEANKAYLYSLNGNTGGDTPEPPTPGDVKSVTVAEFNAAAESQTQVYELVGTIGGSINTTYGNFDLTDATGTVYVYGLTKTELGYGTQNDKSYPDLGLKEGDKIKIRGYRGSFGDKIEVMYAWFIEKVDGGDPTPGGNGSGTQADPYTPKGAIDAVKDLTWTSNTDYQSTEDVYVKGKISRIASGGTYTEGGTYGNASFYISADGTETDEFYAFRILYLENKKFEEGQTDIKVGDEVVIYGKLMNYKGNTPETVSGKAYLYSLNGSTTPGGGGDTPTGSSVSFETNASAQTWSAETDGTYGAGFSSTTQGVKVGYYKHTSTSTAVAPNDKHIRVYKNSVLSVTAPTGKKIKEMVLTTEPNAGTSKYCWDMAGLEGGASATANETALTVTWSGSAEKIVLQANNGQVRVKSISLTFE